MSGGITVGTSGGNQPIDEITVGTSGGNKTVDEVWVGTASGNRQVFDSADISLTDRETTKVSTGSSTAQYFVRSNGLVVFDNGSSTFAEAWITPESDAPGDYEVRMTQVSGDPIDGTLGTWLALTSDRGWSMTSTTGNNKEGSGLVEIRNGNGFVFDSASIIFDPNAI